MGPSGKAVLPERPAPWVKGRVVQLQIGHGGELQMKKTFLRIVFSAGFFAVVAFLVEAGKKGGHALK